MITIEEARKMLNEVRKKESVARSEWNKYKTEEYNNALKKVKAERRKVVKLCKAVGMNVSPSGVEQPEGAPIWVKKKFRKNSEETPNEKSNVVVQKVANSEETPDEKSNVEVQEVTKSEETVSLELEKYCSLLDFLKSNAILTEDVEKAAYDFIKEEFKNRELKLNRYRETLRELVKIGNMTEEEYESHMNMLRKSIYDL